MDRSRCLFNRWYEGRSAHSKCPLYVVSLFVSFCVGRLSASVLCVAEMHVWIYIGCMLLCPGDACFAGRFDGLCLGCLFSAVSFTMTGLTALSFPCLSFSFFADFDTTRDGRQLRFEFRERDFLRSFSGSVSRGWSFGGSCVFSSSSVSIFVERKRKRSMSIPYYLPSGRGLCLGVLVLFVLLCGWG